MNGSRSLIHRTVFIGPVAFLFDPEIQAILPTLRQLPLRVHCTDGAEPFDSGRLNDALVFVSLDQPVINDGSHDISIEWFLGGIKKIERIPAKYLKTVPPQVGHAVLVIRGSHKGFVGEVKEGEVDKPWLLQPPQVKPKPRSRSKSAKTSKAMLVPELPTNLVTVFMKK